MAAGVRGTSTFRKERVDGWAGGRTHSDRAVLPPGLLSLLSRTSSWDRSSRSCTERQAVAVPVRSGAARPLASYLLQVHVLGQLLLQHVLELLVHLSQVLVSRFDQISEH